MSKRSRVQTIKVPWRKVCGALPAVALIGSGIAITALAGPAHHNKGGVVSKRPPAIVVPDVPLAVPAAPAPGSVDPFAESRHKKSALVLPEGTVPGSLTPVTLDSTGIPVRALKAYRDAAALVGSADPGCHIDWALLAAIGRVESDHARFAGNRLDSAGVAKPGIIGISLNGSNGTARITDSDGGRLDRDSVYDRAVGPMQFIPSTWRVAGTDADGDRVKNPQDMADAATATAIYLCSGPGDLRQPTNLRAALMRYNASDSYVRTVTAIADAYRHGVTALPASALPSASSAPSMSVVANPVNKPTRVTPRKTTSPKTTPSKPTPRNPAAGQPGSLPTNVPGQQPGGTQGAPKPSSPTPTAASPVPAAPEPASPAPAAPAPAAPAPAAPAPAAPAPAAPVRTSTATSPVRTSTATSPVPTEPLTTEPVPAPLIPCLPTKAPPANEPPS
jgi:hypothetical protein